MTCLRFFIEAPLASSRLGGDVESHLLLWVHSANVGYRDDVEDRANDGAKATFARIVGGCD